MRGAWSKAAPILTVLAILLAVWYVAAMALNLDLARNLADDGATSWEIVQSTLALDRPLLPAPHQIAGDMWSSIFDEPIAGPKSLVYHASVTATAAAVGFLFALALGIVLAVGIVHLRVLERSLMLWIIASQTVPVLAIAPMVVVALGNMGLTGLLPKALISGYLSFFPVVTGVVKGLRSPDPLQRDLMRPCLFYPSAAAVDLPRAVLVAPPILTKK